MQRFSLFILGTSFFEQKPKKNRLQLKRLTEMYANKLSKRNTSFWRKKENNKRKDAYGEIKSFGNE